MKSNTDAAVLSPARTRTSDFVTLAKPRLNLLVVGSAAAGYAMAGGDTSHVFKLVCTILGTGLVAGGASAYNQILERKTDALMQRTRSRPLPDGRLQVSEALLFATALSSLGLATLFVGVNTLSALVALATLVSYVAVYTPLKPVTSFATVIGAIPGALPPVIGWVAAREDLTDGAWLLFGIVFLWQLPHFLSIAWMFREDYARAGFPMLPVLEPDGRSTGRQSVIYSAALVPLSLAPTLIGLTGRAYFAGAFALAAIFMALTIKFALSRSRADAKRLFFGSIIYLPMLWILMIANRV
jgi:heme o synthase